MSEPLPAITEDDARSLAEKLAAFSETLTAAEQKLLADTLVRGTATTNDVQGFTISTMFGLQSVFLQNVLNTTSYNQTLASSVRKKLDDTSAAIINKV
jgi:hypothetical protein